MVSQFQRAPKARDFAPALVAAIVLATVGASSASAATVSANGFVAAVGEVNDLTVTQGLSAFNTTITYRDARNPVTASGTSCTESGSGPGNSVTCTVSGGFGSVVIALLDGNDQTTFVDVTDVIVNQRGGTGDDVLRGPQLFGTSLGGDGDDALFAATGSDPLFGQDSLSGEAGNDVLTSSASRTGSVLMDGAPAPTGFSGVRARISSATSTGCGR